MAALTVYHSNDVHGQQDLLDLLEARGREADSLLVDVGDAIEGSNTAFRLSEPILARMGRLGYAAMAMGNREFHYLRAVLRMRRSQRTFPCLAANLEDLRGDEGLWERSVELQVAGVKVGLFGATPVQYPHDAWPERMFGFRFHDPAECLPALAEELASRNDLVIFLSHLGAKADRALAPRLPGVDLVLGGHSHTLFTVPERVGDVWVVQAGSHARFLGRLELEPGPRPIGIHYELLSSEREPVGARS